MEVEVARLLPLLNVYLMLQRNWIRLRNEIEDEMRRRRNLRAYIIYRMRRRPQYAIRRSWRFVNSQGFWERDVPTWPDDVFQKAFRMQGDTFRMLVDEIGARLTKMSTRMREPIPVPKRIAIALFYLKSGSDLAVVGNTFGVGKTTVWRIVGDFCDAIIDRFYAEKIKFPRSDAEMADAAQNFLRRWQFPGVLGAIDGSHIPVLTPEDNGEEYYNYKGWHSVILLAVADHRYRFSYVNVGFPGKVNDAGVLQASGLWDLLNSGEVPSEYHIIGDGAFPLHRNLMKPFRGETTHEQENFNYRLSRARMVIENAFGRLKGRWRALMKQVDTNLTKTSQIIVTCCILHNICEERREFFHAEWLENVANFNVLLPQPEGGNLQWNNVEGNEKRVNLIRMLSN